MDYKVAHSYSEAQETDLDLLADALKKFQELDPELEILWGKGFGANGSSISYKIGSDELETLLRDCYPRDEGRKKMRFLEARVQPLVDGGFVVFQTINFGYEAEDLKTRILEATGAEYAPFEQAPWETSDVVGTIRGRGMIDVEEVVEDLSYSSLVKNVQAFYDEALS